MAEKILVTEEALADGARLIQELDRRGFPVTAAFWAYDPVLEVWRLIIAAPPNAVESLMNAYRQIQEIIEDSELVISLGTISLIPDSDSTVENLRALAKSGIQDVIETSIGSAEIAGHVFDGIRVYRHEALRYERMVFEALQRIQPPTAILRDAHRLEFPRRFEVDFLLDDGRKAISVEAKLWPRPVSSKVVWSARNMQHRLSEYLQRRTGVIIVSGSDFTQAALDEASHDREFVNDDIRLVVWRGPQNDDDLRQAVNQLFA